MKIKLPSLNYLASESGRSLMRFPLTLISAALGVAVCLYLIEHEKDIENELPYINLMLTAALGIPLYFSAGIFRERYNLGALKAILLHITFTALLVLVYFSFPDHHDTTNRSMPYFRYAIYNIAAHLLVSFIPFTRKRELNGFWNYNKVLFLRIFFSAVYSFFLYTGLVLAILSMDLLFEMDIDEKIYFKVFVTVVGIFNTWFFLSGIPRDIESQEEVRTYPSGLKIFSQYILLPLLAIYLIILYLYGGKIVLSWNWPNGIVSWLIVIISVLGILDVLLVYPYAGMEENKWLKQFSRTYYFLLIPLIAMLFFAIGIRISDYGITINRYLILVLGIWLSFVSLYYSMGGSNIKVTPVSLAILLALISFGPWGMFSVSEKDQVGRLEDMLIDAGILTDQGIANEVIFTLDSAGNFLSEREYTNEGKVDDSTHNEIKSIIDYLDDNHGFRSMRHYYSQNLDSLITIASRDDKYFNEAGIYMRALGLNHTLKGPSNSFRYSTGDADVMDVADFDYVVEFNSYLKRIGKQEPQTFTIDSLEYEIRIDTENNQAFLLTAENDSLVFDMSASIDLLVKAHGEEYQNDIEADKMSYTADSDKFHMKLMVSSMNLEKKDGRYVLTSLDGNLLLGFKPLAGQGDDI